MTNKKEGSYRPANPALSDEVFQSQPSAVGSPMTLEGTVEKAFTYILLALAAGCFGFVTFPTQMINGVLVHAPGSLAVICGGALSAFVVGLIIVFNPPTAPALAPVYAVLEGISVGALSGFYEAQYPFIAPQALLLTVSTATSMFFLYRSKIIAPTENFKLGVVSATLGICMFYVAAVVLQAFGILVPVLFGNGFFAILFSLFVVTIAALNLVLDFDFIESGAATGRCPKYMEAYGAFGLMVTLIWLYLELLRLLAKFRK